MSVSFTEFYTETVSTYRPTNSKGSSGFPTEEFTEHIASLPCSLQQGKGPEIEEGGRKYSKFIYILYCDVDADVIKKDRVAYNNAMYEITESFLYPGQYLKITMETVD